MLTTFMLTTHPSFLLWVTSAGETADFLRDRQDFALNGPGVFVSHLFAAALRISSHPESGGNREIGHPPKGLNSPPPKGLTPKGLPLRHRTGAKGLVRSGCRRFPRRVLLGSWASGIRGSRKPGCLRPHTYTVPGRIGRQKGPGACGPGPSFFLWALADGSTRALRKDLGLMYPLRCCPTLFYLWC